MTVTLDQIKALRDKTGVSITACKKALEEANGDEEKAVEVLRKRGETKAAERADRVTGEGVVAVSISNGKAAVVVLTCETDFVAKSPEFVAFAQQIADKVLSDGVDADFSTTITDIGSRMGEKVELRKPEIIVGALLGSYVHSNNKIGSVVALEGGTEEVARDVAMHVAAANPKVLSPTDVSTELVEKEKVIWNDELVKSGKPEAIWSKILMGKEKKFREENALLTQPFVKNPDQNVETFVKSSGGKVVKYVSGRV